VLRAALVMLSLLAATACSGDELPDELPPEQVKDGLAALFAGDHAGDDEAEDGRCFADELTERVSLERLREADVLDDRLRVVADVPPLPQDVAEDWVDAQLACVDFVAASTRAQERATKGALDEDAYADCLTEALSGDRIRAALVATLMGSFDDPAVNDLGAAQDTCARTAS
jgi:hypothetical protein